MEDSSLKKRLFVTFVIAAMFVLLQANPRAQETGGGAGKNASTDRSVVQSRAGGEDASLFRLVRQLTRFRKAGDFDGAARIFADIFPPEQAGNPVFALKTGASLQTNSLAGAIWDAKIVDAAEGAHPVFITPEREKNPSADVPILQDWDGTIYSAPSSGRVTAPDISGSGRARTGA